MYAAPVSNGHDLLPSYTRTDMIRGYLGVRRVALRANLNRAERNKIATRLGLGYLSLAGASRDTHACTD